MPHGSPTPHASAPSCAAAFVSRRPARRIVVATAEPRGAYHLAPLRTAVRNRPDVEVIHLVPYPEPVQGVAWEATAHDAQIVATADRVIITGGTLSAWTDLVWRHAAGAGVEVRYSELAFIADPAPFYGPPTRPHLLRASALCDASSLLVARMFPTAAVAVTGVPLPEVATDSDVPMTDPTSRRVLLLSRPERDQDDPGGELATLARLLESQGLEPVIRCHPREDRSSWGSFAIDESSDVHAAAWGTFAVCGYPGTALSLLAATGHPAVALETLSGFAATMPPHQAQVVPSRVTTAAEALDAILARKVASEAARVQAAGPPGPAAERIVSFWCD
jgi:hypothetical protein